MKRVFLAVLMTLFLAGTAVAGEVTLAWNASVGINIAGYRGFEHSGGGYDFNAPAWDVAGLTATVTLPDGKHWFVVRAVNSIGDESGNSNEAYINDGPFPALAPFSGTDVVGGIQLVWPSVADAVEYRIYRRKDTDPYQQIWSDAALTSYTDLITDPAEYYWYVVAVRVHSIDSQGTTLEESAQSISIYRDYRTPNAPSGLTVNATVIP